MKLDKHTYISYQFPNLRENFDRYVKTGTIFVFILKKYII